MLNTRPAFEAAFKILQAEIPHPYFTAENFELLLKNWGAFWENCPLPSDAKTKAMHFYGDAYRKTNTTAAMLIPNAKEVLSFAKKMGFQQVLVSNKIQWAIEAEVEHFCITDCFSKIQGVEKGLHPDKKPSRSYGEAALNGLNYSNLIVIGDSADDATFAQNLSAECLYLGTTDIPNLNGQRVHSLTDVQTILRHLTIPTIKLKDKTINEL